MGNPAPVTAAKTPRLTWVRKAADQVPTKWFVTILAAVFLLATAAFGSLNDAPAAEIPSVEPETAISLAEVDVTLERAVLIDTFTEAGVNLSGDQRVLVIVATLTNTTDRPIATSPAGGLYDFSTFLQIPSLPPDVRMQLVTAFDDAAMSPVLNPSVPVDVVFGWAVPQDFGHDASSLQVLISDAVQVHGQAFVPEYEWSWMRGDTVARIDLPLEDVGAGADAAEDE